MVTDDIKKLIAEAREFTDGAVGYVYKSDWDYDNVNPLIDRLAKVLQDTAADRDYMVINAAGLRRAAGRAQGEVLRQRDINRRSELQYQELEAERDALRGVIREALPFAETADLRRILSRAIDTKERTDD